MSSAQRKLLNRQPLVPLPLPDEEDESSEEEVVASFTALSVNEESNAVAATSKKKKKKKKPKKKETPVEVKPVEAKKEVNGAKNKKTASKKKGKDKEEDFDEILREFGGKTSEEKGKESVAVVEAKKEDGIFCVSTSKLNPDAELKQLFGGSVARGMVKKNSVKMVLSRKDPAWPEPRFVFSCFS